jgi:hypothetical protein
MQHKALVFAVIVAGLLVGCRKPTTDGPDPQSWFIESYTGGVVTVQYEAKTYKATNTRSLTCYK